MSVEREPAAGRPREGTRRGTAERADETGWTNGLPRRVRDAARFVHDRAATPVTVADIAAAVGLSTRGLQKAFQDELGQTPGAYLRGVRLEGVRRDLQSASSADRPTVAEVAKRWQFSNAGRMAAAYRAAFGAFPSAALRYFEPDDAAGTVRGADAPDGAPTPAEGRGRRRFRLVLDCEVDVDDPRAALASVLRRGGTAPWQGYHPDGDTEDLVAFVLGSAIRSTSDETDGMRLLAVNPLIRVPDEHGAYGPADLPVWGPRPASGGDVHSSGGEEDDDG